MTKVWKIVTITNRMGGGLPMKEFYLVAAGNTAGEALQALHGRKNLDDAQVRVDGEAPSSVVDFFDVKPGEILCVMAVT